MKTLYLDLGMGAAGDMLTAALLGLFTTKEQEALIDELNSAGIPTVKYVARKGSTCGVYGLRMHVMVNGEEEGEGAATHGGHEHHHDDRDDYHHSHDHEHDGHHHHSHDGHHHATLSDIHSIIDGLSIPESVRGSAKDVYDLIARAEADVHGADPGLVHFHEVGAMDAVADVVAVSLLMDRIAPAKVIASGINTGSGTVKCAHGIMPVPAPATALLLEGMVSYSNGIRGELCTPTGAALLKYYVNQFGPMPPITTAAVSNGLGHKEFEQANMVRVFLGESEDENENIAELICSMDDITGEDLGYAMERILDAGALETYFTHIQMKKSRPGVLLTVMCPEDIKDDILKVIFANTTTIGIREYHPARHKLRRSYMTVDGDLGSVDIKISEGYGVRRQKPEYEDIAAIAREKCIPLDEVRRLYERTDKS